MRTNRITMQDLETQVDTINLMIGHPLTPSYNNPGQYILDASYGGYKLTQVTTEHGATDITSGYVSKRELHAQLRAMIIGLNMKKA